MVFRVGSENDIGEKRYSDRANGTCTLNCLARSGIELFSRNALPAFRDRSVGSHRVRPTALEV